MEFSTRPLEKSIYKLTKISPAEAALSLSKGTIEKQTCPPRLFLRFPRLRPIIRLAEHQNPLVNLPSSDSVCFLTK